MIANPGGLQSGATSTAIKPQPSLIVSSALQRLGLGRNAPSTLTHTFGK